MGVDEQLAGDGDQDDLGRFASGGHASDKADERAAADVMLDYCFDEHTKTGGYGTMDPAVWQEQIELYAGLGQFAKRTPKVEEVMTLDILKATEASRPRIG